MHRFGKPLRESSDRINNGCNGNRSVGKSALMNLEVSVERLQNELDSKHQKLATQAELLIHSKNVKSNFIEAVSKLHPYLTHEGRAKFFSMLKQIIES